QLPGTLSRYYAGCDDLVLVAVEAGDLENDLKFEASRDGALFPHLYTSLPVSAVRWTAPIRSNDDGTFTLPNCPLVERLRAAADTLEFISNNRQLLAGVPPEDRERLLRLAGEVYMPDPAVRRHLLKTTKRGRRVEKREREEALLSETGIRRLRRQAVHNTPNV